MGVMGPMGMTAGNALWIQVDKLHLDLLRDIQSSSANGRQSAEQQEAVDQGERVLEHAKLELYKTTLMGHAVDCWAQTEHSAK